MAVSGTAQWDSLSVKNRLQMASFKIQECANQSKVGFGMIALGLGTVGTFGVMSKENPAYTGIAIGGAFVSLFGLMLVGTAQIHLHDASLWISPAGASLSF